ncbi:hypothetical protein CISG_00332 [Coccidioides immitis RMSCC 3703]|uniref:Uncharacterized protein n=1 Tax=Coccidioides immitis RMSCC 3703 TaxID=454286 RepID=A0A0J8QLD1_COCIT|nr:hypothetical protein CISG_00332 [Coccidioides immitis RMSCC 3703]
MSFDQALGQAHQQASKEAVSLAFGKGDISTTFRAFLTGKSSKVGVPTPCIKGIKNWITECISQSWDAKIPSQDSDELGFREAHGNLLKLPRELGQGHSLMKRSTNSKD